MIHTIIRGIMKKVYAVLIALFISLAGFSQSCLPEGIAFQSQAEIDNFQTNYPNCTEIEGNVFIEGSNITNLNGLNLLNSIGCHLSITYNPSLTSLTGLDNLTSIGQSLFIQGNTALTSLTGLDNLNSIGSGLDILGNHALTSLTGLDNLTSIGGFIYIYVNNALISLTGLDNLTSIGDYLEIDHNEVLTSLTGLDNLTFIGGRLAILNNHALTSLTGLNNINARSINDLYIHDNHYLSTCAIQSICDYLASPNGTIDIHGNATGCISETEVDSACVYLSTDEIYLQYAFLIYPNPASTQITISTPTTPDKTTTLTIIDITGKEVMNCELTQDQTVVDVSGLSQGVYFVRVVNDRTVQVGKFVKQ
jgi:hypothetical protein